MAGLGIQPIPPEAVPSKQESALAKIRALYAQAKREQHLDLPLPRNPLLQVRYGVIDTDDIADTAKTQQELRQDILIAACECILVRTDTGEFEPLLYGGEPVRFDHRLSELAGLGVPPVEEGGTARQVVIEAFSGAPSPYMAITNHTIQLERWMAGEGAIDEGELLGES